MTDLSLKLCEVCSIQKGSLNPQRHPDECFAHYSIPAFDDGMRPVLEMGSAIKSQKTQIPKGAVLVSKLNPRIPRVWFVRDAQAYRRICSTEFVPFVPDTTRLLPEYLAFALRRLLAGGQITGNTSAATKSRERAKPNEIADLEIPVPPIDEQRLTVDLLSRAEGIVRLRREAQQKAAELIPAIFIDMFGDPATNSKEWPVSTLGDVLAAADYGSSTKASQTDAGLPIIRMGNVTTAGDLDLDDLKYVELSSADADRFRLRKGDLLFNRTNSKDLVGKTGLWDGRLDAVLASYFIRLRARSESAHPTYLWAWMNSRHMKRVLFDTARGAIGQANINSKELKAFPVAIPPLKLQHEFDARVQEIASIQSQQRAAVGKAVFAFEALLAHTISNLQQ